MEIYLVRHTAVGCAAGTCYGQLDVELAPTFQQEAERVEKKLSDVLPGALLFSSPLTRCLTLAQYIARDGEVTVDDRLKELNFGDWEGKPWSDLDWQDTSLWMKDYVHRKCPNGESYGDLFARMNHFFDEIENTDIERVIIFSHAGILRSALARYASLTPEMSFVFRVDYGGVCKIAPKPHRLIHYVNR
ncbi:MAG: alpha-ribazole phosphatase [Verrucomicrobiota bacterium]|nr:alpha-ribazole phosphatase [Verrucomicrobiota bacterium]